MQHIYLRSARAYLLTMLKVQTWATRRVTKGLNKRYPSRTLQLPKL
jgi:hypothetical protein